MWKDFERLRCDDVRHSLGKVRRLPEVFHGPIEAASMSYGCLPMLGRDVTPKHSESPASLDRIESIAVFRADHETVCATSADTVTSPLQASNPGASRLTLLRCRVGRLPSGRPGRLSVFDLSAGRKDVLRRCLPCQAGPQKVGCSV